MLKTGNSHFFIERNEQNFPDVGAVLRLRPRTKAGPDEETPAVKVKTGGGKVVAPGGSTPGGGARASILPDRTRLHFPSASSARPAKSGTKPSHIAPPFQEILHSVLEKKWELAQC